MKLLRLTAVSDKASVLVAASAIVSLVVSEDDDDSTVLTLADGKTLQVWQDIDAIVKAIDGEVVDVNVEIPAYAEEGYESEGLYEIDLRKKAHSQKAGFDRVDEIQHRVVTLVDKIDALYASYNDDEGEMPATVKDELIDLRRDLQEARTELRRLSGSCL